MDHVEFQFLQDMVRGIIKGCIEEAGDVKPTLVLLVEGKVHVTVIDPQAINSVALLVGLPGADSALVGGFVIPCMYRGRVGAALFIIDPFTFVAEIGHMEPVMESGRVNVKEWEIIEMPMSHLATGMQITFKRNLAKL